MDITYLGHSAFKIKGKKASLVTDPYPKSVGPAMPSVSADVITVSHDHSDHNSPGQVSGTSRREKPYLITAPGEYEVEGIGVFGWSAYHDNKEGAERGKNTIYTIFIDDLRITHLGDLGHLLSDRLIENIGPVDVLLIPVGGVYTINAEQAAKVVNQLQPAYVIPMHFKTPEHDPKVFGELDEIGKFLREMGVDQAEPQEKLKITESALPEESEVVVLKS